MNNTWQAKAILLIFLLSYLCSQIEVVTATELQEEPNQEQLEQELLDEVSMDGLNTYWQHIQEEYGSFMPEVTRKNLKEIIQQQGKFSIKSFMRGLLHYLFYEVVENGKLLGTLIMLTMFSVILQSIHHAFENRTVSKIAYFIVYIVLIMITLHSFHLVFTYARETIEWMSSFMIALLPLMLGLLASFGQVISVAFFHPIIVFLIHISGLLVNNFVFPLLYVSVLLLIISQLNEDFQATHLAELLKSIAMGTLGVFLSLFLGVISIQGTASAIEDGVALKTTKFITGNFIPVVGGAFTDAADTVLAALLLLKNATGMIGLIIIICITIFPAIKIVVISLMYKLAAALLQPLGNSPIIKCLTLISKYIMYVLACLITVTFMFLLAVIIMVIASNIPLLLR